jgi:hypothetical protein
MAFKNAPKALLNGVTVATADIEDSAITASKITAGTITADKIATGDKGFTLGPFFLGTVAATSNVIQWKAPAACTVLAIGVAMAANGSASSTSIDCHTGATQAAATTCLGASKLTMKAGTTVKTVAPATAALASGGYLKVDIDAVASGTKTALCTWVDLAWA